MSYRVFILFLLAGLVISNPNEEFIFSRQLKLDQVAEIDRNGIIAPINATGSHRGQVFYSPPLQFKNSSTNTAFSFSTTFVFSINSPFPFVLYEGIFFFISSTKPLPEIPMLGYSNTSILSIWIGTDIGHDFIETNDTHLAVKINDTNLIKHSPLGYYAEMGRELQKLKPTNGEPMQVWVEFDGNKKELNVTLAPSTVPKPTRPLLSVAQDLMPLISENMYVGISTSNEVSLSSHYILGWSFKMNGQAQEFESSQLVEFIPAAKVHRFMECEVIEITCYFEGNLTRYTLNSSTVNGRLRKSYKRLRGKAWAA